MKQPPHQLAMSEQLLLAIAEQIKLPLLQISSQAELALLRKKTDDDYGAAQIRVLATNALQLVDAYSLSLRLDHQFNSELAPETASVASILYDASSQLKDYAKLYNVQLELNIGGKFGPVLVHKKGLQSAIVGLASAFIEALPTQQHPNNRTIVQLATHRCRYGIVAGVYADIPGLNNETLRRGRKLYGNSRQPLVDVSHTGAAGIFIADAIFRAMRLRLQVSRHHRLYGLGVVLHPSSQMMLV